MEISNRELEQKVEITIRTRKVDFSTINKYLGNKWNNGGKLNYLEPLEGQIKNCNYMPQQTSTKKNVFLLGNYMQWILIVWNIIWKNWHVWVV